MSRRSEALAKRLEEGADALAAFASGLSDAQWGMKVPGDGRTVGVIVHHVADVYPIEVHVTQEIAAGRKFPAPWSAIHEMNAKHATDNAKTTKDQAIAHLKQNSRVASAAIRALTDEQLDTAAPITLYFDAPLTCQYWVEEHPLRHSYHHLGRIRDAVGRA